MSQEITIKELMAQYPYTHTNTGTAMDDLGSIIDAMSGVFQLLSSMQEEMASTRGYEMTALISVLLDRSRLVYQQLEEEKAVVKEEAVAAKSQDVFIGVDLFYEMLQLASNPIKDRHWVRQAEDIRDRFHAKTKGHFEWMPYKDRWCDFFGRVEKASRVHEILKHATPTEITLEAVERGSNMQD